MNYRHANRWQPWFLVVFAIFLLVVLGGIGRDFLTGPLIWLTKPLWQVSDKFGTVLATTATGLGQNRQSLLVENKNLREENNKLKTQLLAKSDIETDNIKLRAILGHRSDKIEPIVARVIFLPNFMPYNNLLLDLGQTNSLRRLKTGDLVVADGVVLIARLVEIGATYSKARLISAETNLPVIIGNQNIPAVAVGSGIGNFTITLPKATPIMIGDRVTTPLPDNYLIGTVGHIEKLVSRPTQTILVRTPINLWQLKWLEIYDRKT